MGIIVPILTLVFLLFAKVSHGASTPRVILVGGSVGAWKVPDAPNNTLNHWAENTRFKVGDFLVWKYDMKVDSVLEVTKEDYDSCNTAKPLKQYKDGHTEVHLDKSGPYFFISGAPGNCAKGEKITLVVLSERPSGDGSVAPKASPVSPTAPAPAPHNAAGGMKVASGWFLTTVVIGLAMA
ncbi:PREDICTED: early nodulin-like protein 1 [Camelina sativa]|uniref:Early nodulin-like protein 1 n=1 Tax=Camelina sativa TaxID=90675 RepID=A0ABM0UA42_CAMSA|nr:PREDICTED: early nodulin-like protein 1 [Camelina sativa]